MKPRKKNRSLFQKAAARARVQIEPRHVRHRNVAGKLNDFRGRVDAPVNENGVIFLFGKVVASTLQAKLPFLMT